MLSTNNLKIFTIYDERRHHKTGSPRGGLSDYKNAENALPRRASERPEAGTLVTNRFSWFGSELPFMCVSTGQKILLCLLITNPGFLVFPDRFKNTADIIPYFFTAWIDLECTFKGSQGFLVLPELF